MNILVTGANGQLGQHLRLLAPQSSDVWHFTDVEQLDITQSDAVRQYMQTHAVELVVNCAAYTNVDQAESHEAEAMLLNAEAVRILADACNEQDATLLHISTDYVFGGQGNLPRTEQDPVAPTSIYGRTKLLGEQAAATCRSVVLRTAWLYSRFGRNFLLTMLRLTAEKERLNVVFDQVGTPTYAGDLAAAICTIIARRDHLHHTGLYHFSNEGVCSWYDFACAIAHYSGHDACRIEPCHSSEFPSPVCRPPYSVLDKTLFRNTFCQTIPHWTDGLRRCLEGMKP